MKRTRKGSKHYLTPEFLEKLRRKTYQHFVNANFRRRSDGTRFPKELTETPVFLAISQLLRPGHLQPDLDLLNLESFDEADHKAIADISFYVTAAILCREPGKIRDLVTMVEFCLRPPERKPFYTPWIFFTGSAALAYLNDGTVPTKEQVIEEAIRRCAFFELWLKTSSAPGAFVADPDLLTAKIEDIRRHRSPRKWRHIFEVLDLTELPA